MKKAKIKKKKNIFFENIEILKIAFTFALLAFAFNFIYFKIVGDDYIARSFTATLVTHILNLVSICATVEGPLIFMTGLTFDVVSDCTGIFSIIVFCSAIFAYPTQIKHKIIGLAGIPILYIMTIIRIVSTAFVGLYIPILFDFVHVVLWQLFLILTIAILFILWRDEVVLKGSDRS